MNCCAPTLEPLAHSARDGAQEQTYREHADNVFREATLFARAAAALSPKWCDSFVAAVERAAAYHDLGKLDELFQEVLRHNRKNKHGFNHVEAGTAHLLRLKQFEAAFTTYSHHIGLQSVPKEKAKFGNGQNLVFRDTGELEGLGQAAWQRTDEHLGSYLHQHHGLFDPVLPVANQHFTGLVRRLALSCLVDADHSDTARHYRNERDVPSPDLRAAERLARLDEYVASLAAKNPPLNDRERQRLKLRQDVYRSCRERGVRDEDRILACDSPVGTGKTTAIMAHLLRVASERKLRRVFVVLPFTNIIDQSVEVYRRALRMAGESETAMESVVAAHHHRVDFSSYEARCLAARWDSPIVVTTAVQFFETLAARDTASLRKLHQVAGSAIFVDEAHAAVPPALWPQMLRWLRELCDDWGCHLVLASGTLQRFWNRPGFLQEAERRELPDLIGPEVRAETMQFEEKRVLIRTEPQAMSIERLAGFVHDKPGPRLIIFNTVQSAAVFAQYLREDVKLGLNVEHISTALTPRDRACTVARVKEHLASRRPDWTLVATSCVEAGVDFSFRTAFRESWGLVNLLQIAGRASRSGEYDDAEVWDFRHDADNGFSLHPQAKLSRRILQQLFTDCARQNRQPGPDDCTDALQREVLQDHGEKALRMDEIFQAEKDADYPQVAKLCRIIDAATQTVVVEPGLIQRLENPDRSQWPDWREMMLGSVQLWASRLDAGRLPVKPLGHDGELWAWIEGNYDNFIGYMAGVLPLLRAGKTGFEPL
ncbi:MAG: DEAD/DEAH box helicase family protein [Verrucomicrobiota bacterium]